MSKSNQEYLHVLTRVVDKVQSEYAVNGLPELTPAQLHRWFHQVKLEDIEHVASTQRFRKAA